MEFPEYVASESVVWADFSKSQIIINLLKINRKIINHHLKQLRIISDNVCT